MQPPRNLTRELPPAMSTIRPLTTMALQTTRTATRALLRTGHSVRDLFQRIVDAVADGGVVEGTGVAAAAAGTDAGEMVVVAEFLLTGAVFELVEVVGGGGFDVDVEAVSGFVDGDFAGRDAGGLGEAGGEVEEVLEWILGFCLRGVGGGRAVLGR